MGSLKNVVTSGLQLLALIVRNTYASLLFMFYLLHLLVLFCVLLLLYLLLLMLLSSAGKVTSSVIK